MQSELNESIEILVVEDSTTQALELQNTLEENGYQVTLAHNGPEALAAINKRKPSIVITDILMPGMDGYELCKQIKATEKFKDLPVILLTSLSDPEDIIKGLECAADNFVVKPYNKKFLLSRLHYIAANQALRRDISTELGIQILFRGKRHFLTAERVQMIDLLLSTYEAAVQKNLELKQAYQQIELKAEELNRANTSLANEILTRKEKEAEIESLNEILEMQITQLATANEKLHSTTSQSAQTRE